MAHNRRLSQFANTVGYNGGHVGIGTDNPNRKLVISQANSTAYSGTDFDQDYHVLKLNNFTDSKTVGMQFLIGSNGEAAITATETSDGATDLIFGTRGSGSRAERLRITSAGQLKIGSNTLVTPDANADNFVIDTGDVDSGLSILSATTGRIYFGDAADDEAGSIRYVHTDNSMRFETNSAERLRITSAGQLNLAGNMQFTAATPELEFNNGGPRFRAPAANTLTIHTGGGLGATSNERLRIDSSGRLLIGAASARTNFNNGTASPQIQIENVSNGNQSSIALIHNENATGDSSALHFAKTRGGSVGDDSALNQAGDRLGQIVFSGNDGSEFVQAATIEGFTDGTPGNNDMPGRLSFSVTHDGASSTVERMRITRKGFMKMGPRITDGSHGAADMDSARHEFTSDDNGWTLYVQHTSGAASEAEGILVRYRTTSPNGTGNSFIQGQDSNTTRFRFASNGGLYNYSGNNSNLSDEREKKNIVSLDAKWDKVKSWDIKKFHYNEDADSDDLRYGVIAQQVEEHCPEVVSDWVKQQSESAVLDEDGNVVTPAVPEITRKGVKEQQMMWMAIKALQEAQTRIETLEAQVAALQGS